MRFSTQTPAGRDHPHWCYRLFRFQSIQFLIVFWSLSLATRSLSNPSYQRQQPPSNMVGSDDIIQDINSIPFFCFEKLPQIDVPLIGSSKKEVAIKTTVCYMITSPLKPIPSSPRHNSTLHAIPMIERPKHNTLNKKHQARLIWL